MLVQEHIWRLHGYVTQCTHLTAPAMKYKETLKGESCEALRTETGPGTKRLFSRVT